MSFITFQLKNLSQSRLAPFYNENFLYINIQNMPHSRVRPYKKFRLNRFEYCIHFREELNGRKGKEWKKI